MKYPIYIAKHLNYSESSGSNSYILRFAMSGLALAVLVMMLSIAIVSGFRNQIISTIYSIDNHIKVSAVEDYNSGEKSPVKYSFVSECIDSLENISSATPVIEEYAILKTDNDFQGIKLRGFDYSTGDFIVNDYVVEGRAPITSDTTLYDIAISQTLKDKLGLEVGNKVSGFFIDDRVRMRNFNIVGVYNTNFEDYDNVVAFCNIAVLRQLKGWSEDECSYVGINLYDTEDIREDSYEVYSEVYISIVQNNISDAYSIENLYDSNISYFAWLDLLDSNIVLILILMAFVVGFTIVAAMLVIIFDRVRTIGVLKSLGATDSGVRHVFVYLTQHLVIKGILIGNVVGAILAWIQYQFHVIKLDPASYYMAWVPIKVNILDILFLDLGVIIFAFITLLVASSVVSRIQISTTIRYE